MVAYPKDNFVVMLTSMLERAENLCAMLRIDPEFHANPQAVAELCAAIKIAMDLVPQI